MALARVRISQGKGKGRHARVVASGSYRPDSGHTLGVEEFLAPGCPRCYSNEFVYIRHPTHPGKPRNSWHQDVPAGATETGTTTSSSQQTVHARPSTRDGAPVNTHEPLNHAPSRALNGLRVKHDVQTGAPFTGSMNTQQLPLECPVYSYAVGL